MAPTASIALTLSAIVAVTSFASPIAVLICAIPMLASPWRTGTQHVARQLRRHLRVGRPRHLTVLRVDDRMGDHPGLLPGRHLDRLPDRAVLPVARLEPVGGLDTAAALIGAIAIVGVTAVAYVGIRATSRFQGLLIVIEYVAITIVGILGLIGIFGGGSHSEHFDWSWFSWSSLGGVSGLVNASLIAVYMYSGWDTAILLNEETRTRASTRAGPSSGAC